MNSVSEDFDEAMHESLQYVEDLTMESKADAKQLNDEEQDFQETMEMIKSASSSFKSKGMKRSVSVSQHQYQQNKKTKKK